MKTVLTIFIALFAVSFGFSQETAEIELDTSFSAVKSLFLPAILSGIGLLFVQAKKHWKSPDWDWNLFLKSNALPFGLTVVLSIAMYFILAFVPMLKPVLETITESDFTEVTASALFAAAQTAIKGLLKPTLAGATAVENE